MEIGQRKKRIEISLWIIVGLTFIGIILIPFFSNSIVEHTIKIGYVLPIMFIVLFYHVIRYVVQRSRVKSLELELNNFSEVKQ